MENNTSFADLTEEKETEINNVLYHIYIELKNEGYDVLGVFLYGSQNYGLSGENSDIDSFAIVLPSIKDVIKNKNAVSFEKKTDYGCCKVKDIRRYLSELKKGNLQCIECLFSKYGMVNYVEYNNFFDNIRILKDDFVYAVRYNFIKCLRGHLYNLRRRVEKEKKVSKSLAYVYLFEYYANEVLSSKRFSKIILPDTKTRCKLYDIKYGDTLYIYSCVVEKIESIIYDLSTKLAMISETREDTEVVDKMSILFEDVLRQKFIRELNLT